MKQGTSASELYYEILKSFFLGEYHCGDRFATYAALCQRYSVAKNTVSATYDMLRADGFLRADSTKGTIVTFDASNPEHIAKLQFYLPSQREKNFNTYDFPILLLSGVIHYGILEATQAQLTQYRNAVASLLCQIEQGETYHEAELALLATITANRGNEYLQHIMQHFLSRYLYFNVNLTLPGDQREELRAHAGVFYRGLAIVLEARAPAEVSNLMRSYYSVYYDVAGALVFSYPDEHDLMEEQTLYRKLLRGLWGRIYEEGLQPGDAMPATPQLCREYGVSKRTVAKAYSLLSELGMVRSRGKAGASLLAGPEDPKVQAWLTEKAPAQRKSAMDAMHVLLLILWSICKDPKLPLTPRVIADMRAEIEHQKEASMRYGTHFFMTAALLSPLVAAYPPGILHTYYFYVTDALIRFLTFYFSRLRIDREQSESLYRALTEAVALLERGDTQAFMLQASDILCKSTQRILGLVSQPQL